MAKSDSASYSIETKSKSVRTNSQVVINQPCSKVWDTFIELDWRKWNNDLYLIGELPGRLEEGDTILLMANHTLWYNPFNAFKVKVKITKIRPEEFFVWEGRPMGVYGEHGLRFEKMTDDSCKVTQWEEGFGPMARVGKKAGVFDSIGRIHVNLLNGLKTHMER